MTNSEWFHSNGAAVQAAHERPWLVASLSNLQDFLSSKSSLPAQIGERLASLASRWTTISSRATATFRPEEPLASSSCCKNKKHFNKLKASFRFSQKPSSSTASDATSTQRKAVFRSVNDKLSSTNSHAGTLGSLVSSKNVTHNPNRLE